MRGLIGPSRVAISATACSTTTMPRPSHDTAQGRNVELRHQQKLPLSDRLYPAGNWKGRALQSGSIELQRPVLLRSRAYVRAGRSMVDREMLRQ